MKSQSYIDLKPKINSPIAHQRVDFRCVSLTKNVDKKTRKIIELRVFDVF